MKPIFSKLPKLFGRKKDVEAPMDDIAQEEAVSPENPPVEPESTASPDMESDDDNLYNDFEDIFGKLQAEEGDIDDIVKNLEGEYEKVDYDSIPDNAEAPYESLQEYTAELRAAEEAAEELEYEEDAEEAANKEVEEFLEQYAVQPIVTESTEVYESETSSDSANEETTKPVEEKGSKLLFAAMLGIAVLLVAIIILVYGFLIAVLLNSNSKKAADNIKVIEAPGFAPNNMNFLMINDVKTINGRTLTLKKVLADPIATVFYFQGNIDTRAYHFVLYDGLRKMYNMDLSFSLNQASDDDQYESETLIRFEPFRNAVSGLTLEVTDIATKEKTAFKYTLGSYPDSMVKYLNEPIEIDAPLQNVNLTIVNAVFSGAGSIIEYLIEWPDDAERGDSFGAGSRSESIGMSSNGRTLAPQRKKPLEYNLEAGSILGRMDFEAVKDLNSNATVHFKDLALNITYNDSVDVQPLLNYRDESGITLDFPDHRIILERLGIMGERLVLVYHAIDKRVDTSGPNDTGNRVEAVLDTEMILESDNGMEIILSGNNIQTKRIGADIVYDLSSYKTMMSRLTGIQYKLRINNINIKLNDLTATIELSGLPTKEDVEKTQVKNIVTTAFNQRLAYKSGRSALQNLTGFIPELLENEELMRHYTPQKPDSPAMYSSQTIAHYFSGESFIGIVQESWSASVNGVDTVFHRTHRIRADKLNNRYIITEDEIL